MKPRCKMCYEILKSVDDRVNERNNKLKSIYPNFKSIADKLGNEASTLEFWKKESENILKAVTEAKKMKESMKMSPEKFRQEFTI